MPEPHIPVRLDDQFRVAASQETLPKVNQCRPPGSGLTQGPLPGKRLLGLSPAFPLRQGQEPEVGRPPGQRLAHPSHEEKVLGTSQKVKPPSLTASVDGLFKVRQKFRGILDFVQDHRRWVQLEKAAGVCRSRGPDVWELQRDITVDLAEEMLE